MFEQIGIGTVIADRPSPPNTTNHTDHVLRKRERERGVRSKEGLDIMTFSETIVGDIQYFSCQEKI